MSERSEQRCFEIMNMNDKTFIFSPDAPSGFFSRIFSGKNFSKFFSPEFSAEKIFQNFFQKFFSPEFSAEKIFQNFFQKFFSPEFSAEYFFTIFFTRFFQRNIFSASLSGTQELNLSGYPFHLTKAFFFFWSRRITFSIRKIF